MTGLELIGPGIWSLRDRAGEGWSGCGGETERKDEERLREWG